MRPVTVLILHPLAPAGAGPLVSALADARRALATWQRDEFLAAGADRAEVVEGAPDERSFGERLTEAVTAFAAPDGGLVVIGSGSVPLARRADLLRFVEAAAAEGPDAAALANNYYSADIVAIPRVADLAGLARLPADNALPRWLEERAGLVVADLRRRWRLGVDLDSPADLAALDAAGALPRLLRRPYAATPVPATRLLERLRAIRAVMADRRAELLVAGRVASSTLRALDTGTGCRVRALVEERGLRASSPLAQSGASAGPRGPRSVLGELLDRDGPEALGGLAARLGDAAVVDTRVLLAHRCGADERRWPAAEDRFASDVLEPSSIADPWLRALTEAALDAPVPIVLGGHTLVNGGLRLLAATPARAR